MKRTQPKFRVGDKVRLTSRAPRSATEGLLPRSRTVIAAFYDPDHQCFYYQLGGRGKGELGYWFRSYMLKRVSKTELRHIGKPRVKRRYHRKVLT